MPDFHAAPPTIVYQKNYKVLIKRLFDIHHVLDFQRYQMPYHVIFYQEQFFLGKSLTLFRLGWERKAKQFLLLVLALSLLKT